tara:strand:- start:26 stop:271 length:246 start_codon:yes stop_codon:yes gene_type:complete
MKTFNQFQEDVNELIKGAAKAGLNQFLNSKSVKGGLKDLSRGNLSVDKIKKVGEKRGSNIKGAGKRAIGAALSTIGKGLSK